MNNPTILEDLSKFLPKSLIKVNEPLKKYTFTKTGGKADFYLSPTSYTEVQKIVVNPVRINKLLGVEVKIDEFINILET